MSAFGLATGWAGAGRERSLIPPDEPDRERELARDEHLSREYKARIESADLIDCVSFNKGHIEGYNLGYQEGFARGQQEGFDAGYGKGVVDAADAAFNRKSREAKHG